MAARRRLVNWAHLGPGERQQLRRRDSGDVGGCKRQPSWAVSRSPFITRAERPTTSARHPVANVAATTAPARPSFVCSIWGPRSSKPVSAWEPIVVSAGPRREGPPQRSRVISPTRNSQALARSPTPRPANCPRSLSPRCGRASGPACRHGSRLSSTRAPGEMCLCPFGATVVASRLRDRGDSFDHVCAGRRPASELHGRRGV